MNNRHLLCLYLSLSLSQREPAFQRRLPGDQQEPQISETQQRSGGKGPAGWCGQQD